MSIDETYQTKNNIMFNLMDKFEIKCEQNFSRAFLTYIQKHYCFGHKNKRISLMTMVSLATFFSDVIFGSSAVQVK